MIHPRYCGASSGTLLHNGYPQWQTSRLLSLLLAFFRPEATFHESRNHFTPREIVDVAYRFLHLCDLVLVVQGRIVRVLNISSSTPRKTLPRIATYSFCSPRLMESWRSAPSGIGQ